MAKRDREETKKGLEDLFASSATDLVGNIIAGDRRRSGRGEIDDNYDIMTKNNVIEKYDNKTNNKTSHKTNKQTIKPVSNTAGKQTNEQTKPEGVGNSKQRENLVHRIAEAQKMAESPTITVTLRIPQAMNDWLDGYVHQSWPEKIKKQELVIEALQLIIARRGNPKEEVISTELLPDE